jgi:hypothetical protein
MIAAESYALPPACKSNADFNQRVNTTVLLLGCIDNLLVSLVRIPARS